jgi:tetratricopeptide (TPR) repeat protein
MEPQWERVKTIFAEAMDREPGERSAYLAAACGEDTALRAEVERLLAHHVPDPPASTAAFEPAQGQVFRPGDILAKRFKIIRLLGRGGMGEVYEAADQDLGGKVALKTLRPEITHDARTHERFKREIQFARKVSHQNICRIFDVFRDRLPDREVVWFTMELLEGETLSSYLERVGRCSLQEALELLVQMSEGLAALHRANIVHRDFKPGNVILERSSGTARAVITDFGLARLLPAQSAAQSALSEQGQIIGTPDYMAPEQLLGGEIGPWTDIYALGLVMYEMVAGGRPFVATTPIENAIQKTQRPPKPPRGYVPDLDPVWEQVILRCLEREPEKRPRDALQVVKALENRTGLASDTVGETPESFWRRRRVPLAWAAITTGLAALFALTPTLRNRALDQACQWFPGSALACVLPQDKDLAVLPLENLSEGKENSAFAVGLLDHTMRGLYRLAPDKESTCVHVRDDSVAFGVRLVLTGSVQRTPGRVQVILKLSDAETRRLLRNVTWEAPIADAAELHSGLLRKIAAALEFDIPDRRWEVWRSEGTSDARAFEAYLLGLGHLKRQEYEDAVSSFRLAVNDFPFALAHAGLGDAFRMRYDETGDVKWARSSENAFRQAEGLSDGLPQTFYGLGQLAISLNNYGEAVRRFSQVLKLEEYDFDAQRGLAMAYEALGQPDQADRVNLRNAELRPNCWYVYNHLGLFYAERGDYELATKHFLKLIQLAPSNGTAFSNLSWMYHTQGRYPDAKAAANKAIELNENAYAYVNLGRSLYAEGCYDEAVTALEKAVQLNPSHYRALGLLAELYAGRPDRNDDVARLNAEAVRLAEREAVRQPQDGRPRQHLALSLARVGQTARAQAVIEQALKMAPGRSRTLFFAALVYEISGERQKALSAIEAALRGRYSVFEVRGAPELARLRQTPQYRAMEQQLGLDKIQDAGVIGSAAKSPCTSGSRYEKSSGPGQQGG